jgi:hypothetical protein
LIVDFAVSRRYTQSPLTRFAAVALWMACAINAQAQPAATAELGVPFVLHAGQCAAFAAGVRITLIALTPVGKCPGGQTECIAVSPPQAEVELEANATRIEHLTFLLMGPNSPEQQAGNWKVRIVEVAPYPFTQQDVSLGRASATLLVTAASTSHKKVGV